MLNLKQFNYNMHILDCKVPSIRQVGQLIQQGYYAFSIDLRDHFLHIPIVQHHQYFLHFVWLNKPYQHKVLPFGMIMAPMVFTSLTKPILSLCWWKSLYYYIFKWYRGPDSLKAWWQKGYKPFFALYWFILDYILIYQVWTLSHSSVLFLGLLGYSYHVCVFGISQMSW